MKKRSAAALSCLLCAAVRDVLKTEKSSRRCLASAAGAASRLLPVMIVKIVRITGLEPARGIPPEPKSGASANSAISACPFTLRIR